MAEFYLQKKREESGAGAAEEEDALRSFMKKRRLCPDELECGGVEFPENSASSAASAAYGCSADDFDDQSSGGRAERPAVSPDLEEFADSPYKGSRAGISMEINRRRIDQSSSTPTSEICGDSEQSTLLSPHAACPCRNIASWTAEIEEFFAAAEKYEQKRFAEKYNYDIVEDCPLEGKYEWVPLQPLKSNLLPKEK